MISLRLKQILLVCFTFLLVHCKNKQMFEPDPHTLEIEYKHNIDLAISETNGKLSLPYSLKGNEIARQLKDNKKIANSCIELSHDYEKLGQLNKALKNVLEATSLFEKMDNKKSIALCYNRIGTLYYKQGDTVLSLRYLKNALEIHKQLGLKAYIGGDLTNIGEIYRMTGKLNLAKSCFNEALRHFKKNNDSIEYAYTIGNLGLVYTSVGQTDSATICLNEAGQILKNAGDYYPITVFIAENAKLLLKNSQYEEAVQQTKKSIALAEQEGLLEQISDGYKLLSDIQKLNSNFKEAYKAYVYYHRLRDSLTNADIIRKMENQRINFEISKRENVIENLKQINKLRTKIIIVFGFGFALILILSFILYRITQKLRLINKKLHSNQIELEQKNIKIEQALLEKEALFKEIHHRIKNNLQIISSLLSLQSRRLNNKTAKTAIEDSHQRLQAISLIHQNLYQAENIAFINVREYIHELMHAIKIAFSKKSKTIEHTFDIDDIKFDVDTAVPIGLIINELAINTYKYAFPDNMNGKIVICLKSIQNFRYQLIFEDNGIGLPHNFDPEQLPSLGIRLVSSLAKQLNGKLTTENNNGAKFTLLFKDKDYHQTE